MGKQFDLRPFGVKLLWCEAISASFLVGSYFDSIGISIVILGLVALVLHYLLSQFSDDRWIAAHMTFVWGLASILWGSWLDHLAATDYITTILTIIVVCISYWVNIQVLRWPEIDRWFQSPPPNDE